MLPVMRRISNISTDEGPFEMGPRLSTKCAEKMTKIMVHIKAAKEGI